MSFSGFMLLGPAVLMMLRIYLQIYVEHSERLEWLARSMSIPRAPMFVPLQNPLIRVFSGLIFYLLLPLTMLLFAYKAAVFPAWGSGLLGVAAAVIASHLILPPNKFSRQEKAILSTCAAIIMFAMIVGSGPVRRPFDLFRANLSGQWLVEEDLSGADLRFANLTGAYLGRANLEGAKLSGAKLSGANLQAAELNRANLEDTDLSGAVLSFAKLIRADLSYANLSNANLSEAVLTDAVLSVANLSNANLTGAYVGGAHLTGANLGGANLYGTNLSNANLDDGMVGIRLSDVNVGGAKNLTQEQLDQACGNAATKLPKGLTLKAMCEE
ncbi:hypothetical protein A1D31_20145 [Bradyrhizobium liaoningense]|nr:hypothetical protein A1D31_20145 [Bradyrhizobium liaoningense]